MDNLDTQMEEFQSEVSNLKISGGKTNPERHLLTVGIVLGVLGLILTVAAFLVSRSTSNAAEQRDMIILGFLGMSITFVGGILYLSNKLTRFFRYWLVRLIYEHRSQTDRVVK